MSYDPFESLVKGLPLSYQCVLCVGAVSPSLVRYLADGVGARVHVCDFDEQRLQMLRSEIQENEAVQYHNVLPLFEAGDLPEIGYHCSEPTHSSLALPSGITEVFPGLIFEPIEVKGRAFTNLVEEGNFSTREANLLILATNGYEVSWLAKESAVAALFSTVLIRSPRSNCFETVDTQVLADELAQSGLPAISLPLGRAPYESIVIQQTPDWHAQRFELDALRSESEALQSRLSTLIEDGHAISKRLAAVTSEAESDKAELNKRISSLESDNGALAETLQERDTLANELRTERDELAAEVERQTKWHAENKTWAISLNEQVVKLDADREAQLQSTLLAQKMLSRTQGDLEHLRDQYKAKVASEEQLIQLIGELKQKLTVASNYYFRLQEEHPELLNVSDHNHL
ncbi:hypothetical protein N9N48_07745 [Luminiphilus sp.]|nr:hypothetical protein [Luminiphilus sp.]